MKRLLLIFLFTLSLGFSFAQQKSDFGWGIEKKEHPKTITNVKASPNPFYNQTSVVFKSSKTQIILFSVKNLLGKVVYSKKISAKNGENRIPFYRNKLQKGMYIYSLQTNNEVVVKRIVIK